MVTGDKNFLYAEDNAREDLSRNVHSENQNLNWQANGYTEAIFTGPDKTDKHRNSLALTCCQ